MTVSRRGLWLAIAVVAVVIAVAGLVLPRTFWWEHAFNEAVTGGPLEQRNPSGILPTIRLGASFTDAHTMLYLNGDTPATITSVMVAGGEPSLKFLGAMIATPARKRPLSQQFPGYPPRSPVVRDAIEPAIGSVIQPRDDTRRHIGYELLLGYRFVANKFAARKEVVVNYTVSGTKYELRMPARLIACPTTITQQECLDKADRAFPHG